MPKTKTKRPARKTALGTRKNPVGAAAYKHTLRGGTFNTRTRANLPGAPSGTAMAASRMQGKLQIMDKSKSSSGFPKMKGGIKAPKRINTTPKNPTGNFPRPKKKK